MKSVIILGSSRNDGDTAKVAGRLSAYSNWDTIDLNEYEISYYDYHHNNANDDFIPLMKKLVDNYDTMIFATPVYWYSMSGILKVFFDRLTDLLEIEKSLGRKLRGKNMAALSCSNGSNLGELFWLPFSRTAEYLGMKYLGNTHFVNVENELPESENDAIEKFVNQINSAIE